MQDEHDRVHLRVRGLLGNRSPVLESSPTRTALPRPSISLPEASRAPQGRTRPPGLQAPRWAPRSRVAGGAPAGGHSPVTCQSARPTPRSPAGVWGGAAGDPPGALPAPSRHIWAAAAAEPITPPPPGSRLFPVSGWHHRGPGTQGRLAREVDPGVCGLRGLLPRLSVGRRGSEGREPRHLGLAPP